MWQTDPVLRKYLDNISKKHVELAAAHGRFMELKANKESLLAKLKLEAPVDLKSESAKETHAYARPDWAAFAQGLAHAEVEYERCYRAFQIAMKAYDAAHLTYKNEIPARNREQ